jgi:predicted ATPase
MQSDFVGEAEVAQYLAAESSETPPTGLSGLVHRHSEGNPLFMVAALDHMTQRGLISREGGRWQLSVPIEKVDIERRLRFHRIEYSVTFGEVSGNV